MLFLCEVVFTMQTDLNQMNEVKSEKKAIRRNDHSE